jgi:putative SOS response-associated peptidase YedK
MCGRFTLRTPLNLLVEHFGADTSKLVQLDLFAPRYNIAPTQNVLIVRASKHGAGRQFAYARWGLVPAWTREPHKGPPLINARSETVAEKPSFRSALKSRRCLIAADGFYEWQADEAGKSQTKQPHFIHYPDDRPFAFAGLWERWHNDDEVIESCTLVNMAAKGWMTEIHHRMPIILDPKQYDLWLDPTVDDVEELRHLFQPRDYSHLVAVGVSTHVNRVKNDDPRCVAPEPRLF